MVMNFFHWCLVRYRTVTDTRKFRADLFIFLSRRPVVSQLRSSGRNWFRNIITTKQQKMSVFYFGFCDIMLNCGTWLVLHASERWETSNASGNWCRQWTTSDLVWRYPPWPGSCQSWYVLTASFTPGLQRDRDWVRKRDCLKPLIKMLPVKHVNIFWE